MIIRVLLVLLATLAVLRWLRADTGADWSIFDCLPFCATEKAPFYDIAALLLLVFVVARLSALGGKRQEEDAPGWEWEEAEDGHGWDDGQDDEGEEDDE